jgi:hemerythrin
MTSFQWRNEFSVGNVLIDDDHRQLIKMVNALSAAAEQNNDTAIQEKPLDDLINFTQAHFRNEENEMARIEYAGLAEHKREHEKLFTELKTYIDKESGLGQQMAKFLKDWVLYHIQHSDQHMGEAMSKSGSKIILH